ncbi:hypothetical protein KFK09_007888 [Dendrobium nobile]|uniref:Carbohydrate kinase PfkB domain-containing protein n=1 Tax=Dendrobium nobile TaxID=94219 RepID=A0A8T3BYE9_DENNO|nr:hypothetical protein KFK09_007888 [Dendrobium nobile]
MLIDFVPLSPVFLLRRLRHSRRPPAAPPANVAVGIARLGGSSAFIGKVILLGTTNSGICFPNILKINNVDNSGIRFDTGARTALFMFYRNPSADMLLKESDLDLHLIKKVSCFPMILICDFLPWPSADAAREGIKSIWEYADVIKVSEQEISFLTGGEDPYSDEVVYNKLFHDNLKLLVVTEGEKGCRYYTKVYANITLVINWRKGVKFHGRVGGFKVKAVDTTGAGDSFVSGLLVHLASNLDIYQDEKKLKEALVFANACGAITVTERGAIPSLPTKEAVLDFIPKGNEQPHYLCLIS